MPIKPIVKYPDKRLKSMSLAVETFDQNLKDLIADMYATMYDAEGIGLAAPQIGVNQRVVVIDLSGNGSQKLELVNPKIISKSGTHKSDEGCLSIPGYRDSIKRNSTVKVTACNSDGDEFELEANELMAACLQHEIDHLDGVLFVDHLSQLKKQLFKIWYNKNAPLI